SGTASLLSSVLDEGAGPDESEAFHQALEDKAIELSFHADADWLHGKLKTLTRFTDAAFEVLRLSLEEPRFDQSSIDRMRAQILAELRQAATDPEVLAARAWARLAYPNHPYGSPVQGTLTSVPTIERADLIKMHGALMARDTLKIAVV